MDTYVALPMLRDDALKASRYPILQRFSPVEGNLSVRSQALSVGARESKFLFYLCSVYSLALHPLWLRVTVLLRSGDKCLARWNSAERYCRRFSQDECYCAAYNLNVIIVVSQRWTCSRGRYRDLVESSNRDDYVNRTLVRGVRFNQKDELLLDPKEKFLGVSISLLWRPSTDL